MFKFWYGATMLSIEAQNVIALRMMKLAMGGKHAQAEASRMVTEKIAETMAVAVTLMSGGSGHAVVAQVRRRVGRIPAAYLVRNLGPHAKPVVASNE